MFLLRGVQRRTRSVVFAAIAALFLFICGAVMSFFVAPQQALEWLRVRSLPVLDASGYANVATGEEVVITGTLAGNEALTEDGMLAYTVERWDIRSSATPDNSDSESEPFGSWTTIERVAPPLSMTADGGTVRTLAASAPTFGGNLHETLEPGDSEQTAEYEGQPLPVGSTRRRGFREGDLMTVLGRKGSTGDVAPDRLFAGDRVQLEDSIRSGAMSAFFIGLCMMACAPLVLVFGVLTGVFGWFRR